jgi:hypothetical protein
MANVQTKDGPKLIGNGTAIVDRHGADSKALAVASDTLRIAERIMFTVVGLLLSAVALTLAFRSLQVVYSLIAARSIQTIPLTAHFLDFILLILMIAEIIYTVTLSLRGAVLSPQPFLIVGLIAVIRRILVLTVQEVQTAPARIGAPAQTTLIQESTIELVALTFIVMAFVFAIYLLQRRTVPDQHLE